MQPLAPEPRWVRQKGEVEDKYSSLLHTAFCNLRFALTVSHVPFSAPSGSNPGKFREQNVQDLDLPPQSLSSLALSGDRTVEHNAERKRKHIAENGKQPSKVISSHSVLSRSVLYRPFPTGCLLCVVRLGRHRSKDEKTRGCGQIQPLGASLDVISDQCARLSISVAA